MKFGGGRYFVELIEVKNNSFVTKSNMLIEANYKLGVVEQKIILCLASSIHPTDSDFKTYTLSIKEFTNLLGLKGRPKYTELRQITKELMQKIFEIRIDKKVIQVSWLSYVAYNESEGTIDIRFDPFLRPYLLQLKKEFTSYKLENVVKLKSSYSIRIYELLKQYEKIKERSFNLSKLREMLGAEDIYPAYGNFKQRVLIPAQKELKKKTDISFQIEEIKVGRKVEKLKLIIESGKKEQDKHLKSFGEDPEGFKQPNSFLARIKNLALMMGVMVTDETINSWEKFGQDNVISLIEKIKNRTDIENPIGYITAVLNASKDNKGVSPSQEKMILTHLISYFRKSNEKLPDWFIIEKAVEEIQSYFNMNHEESSSIFEKIKEDLFKILDVADHKVKTVVKEETLKKKIGIKKILEQLKEKSEYGDGSSF
jgi:hypothetical protein